MKTSNLPTKIPKELEHFFWDVKASTVNPSKHPHYVINRLLDKGDLAAARWVIRAFPKTVIQETLKKIRDFSPWNGVFWSRYLDIPREEVQCLNPSYLKMRKQLWPY
ncbi:hypothetical protein HY947_04125 [Candidatus Gottesmanbacteria bacterium]|nr:hypothetical protein [Candidatus Gottesmanbacteria bacterium]